MLSEVDYVWKCSWFSPWQVKPYITNQPVLKTEKQSGVSEAFKKIDSEAAEEPKTLESTLKKMHNEDHAGSFFSLRTSFMFFSLQTWETVRKKSPEQSALRMI